MGFRIRKACPEDKGSVRELDRATVSGPRADLVLKAGSGSGLCQEEVCTELIAYERKWRFVIAMADFPITGIGSYCTLVLHGHPFAWSK